MTYRRAVFCNFEYSKLVDIYNNHPKYGYRYEIIPFFLPPNFDNGTISQTLKQIFINELYETKFPQYYSELCKNDNSIVGIEWACCNYSSHCRFTILSRRVIQNLQNIIVLNLAGHQITKISKDIGKLQKIQHLRLSRNPITRFPSTFYNLRSLKSLKIGHQVMFHLDYNIKNFSNLLILVFVDNGFQTLPLSVRRLSIKYIHFTIPFTFREEMYSEYQQLHNVKPLFLNWFDFVL